jgi:ATP-binding cassette, subfamily B, bacterial MsbA
VPGQGHRERQAVVNLLKVEGWGQVVPLFKGHARLVAGFFLTAIGRSVASILALLTMQWFLSGALDSRSPHRSHLATAIADHLGEGAVIWVAGVGLLGFQVSASLLNYFNLIIQQRLSKIVEIRMMARLIRHLLTLSISYFDKQSQSDIVATIRVDVTQLRVMIAALGSIMVECLLAVGYLVAAVMISSKVALVSLVVIPIAAMPIYLISSRTLRAAFKLRLSGFQLSDIVIEILRGIRVIKIFRAEDTQTRLSVEKGEAFYDNVIEQLKVQKLTAVVNESLSGLLIVAVILYGGSQVMAGHMTWAALLTFMFAIRSVYGPINNMNMKYVEAQSTVASVKRIDEFLKTEPSIAQRPGALPLERAPGMISFDNVSFAYAERQVLHDLSFSVKAGETIGIVGPSGGGKSTLMSLLVRFYDPTGGTVRFDGHDLRDLRLGDIYDQVSLVTQEPFLFTASVRENIRCGRPDATDAEIEAAARAAFIHDDIMALPSGYESEIGIGGREMSGGQRQRLTVARALLKNAPILLLDEATSALDSVAEKEVQRAIDQLMIGRTTFVIAHRLSTLRKANKLLVLEAGRRVGFDTHEALLGNCLVYKKLWEAQFLSEGGGAPERLAVASPALPTGT